MFEYNYADIDECELRIDNCHVNATCADVIGSFVCTCNSGFDGNGVDCTGMKFMCIVASSPLNYCLSCSTLLYCIG